MILAVLLLFSLAPIIRLAAARVELVGRALVGIFIVVLVAAPGPAVIRMVVASATAEVLVALLPIASMILAVLLLFSLAPIIRLAAARVELVGRALVGIFIVVLVATPGPAVVGITVGVITIALVAIVFAAIILGTTIDVVIVIVAAPRAAAGACAGLFALGALLPIASQFLAHANLVGPVAAVGLIAARVALGHLAPVVGGGGVIVAGPDGVQALEVSIPGPHGLLGGVRAVVAVPVPRVVRQRPAAVIVSAPFAG